MHAESGYWRPKLDGTIEVVIAQSTGLVEVQVSKFTCTDYRFNYNSVMVEHRSFFCLSQITKRIAFKDVELQ